MAASSRTSTPASNTAMISLLFGPLACSPLIGKSTGGVPIGVAVGVPGGVPVGGMGVRGTLVGRMGVSVGGIDVAVGGMGVSVGGIDVAVGGTVGWEVGVKPAAAGATCQAMAPMTNRIKIPATLFEINLGTTGNLRMF